MSKKDSKKNKSEPEDKSGDQIKVEAGAGGGDRQLQEALAMIEELEKELADARDKHLRAVAELDNFKRRTEKEKTELSGFVKAGVFRDILGMVDDFERFFHHVENSQEELDKGFVQGVELIHKSLQKTLDKHGVKPVNETGIPVDYNLHEAVMTQPVEDEDQDHTVVEVLEVGYSIGDTLIRPAKVKVGIYGG